MDKSWNVTQQCGQDVEPEFLAKPTCKKTPSGGMIIEAITRQPSIIISLLLFHLVLLFINRHKPKHPNPCEEQP
jgi:hypothetical protein